MFNGFCKDGIKLLEDISCNNTKEYFLTQYERYKEVILEPNKAYVEEMGEYLQILTPTIHAVPKVNHSLFKIYRDCRFHLDEPIKQKIGIIIWQGGGHRMQSSSFYMHYSSSGYFVASGIRWFKPPLLKAYREYIKDTKHRDLLHEILNSLKQKGYKIPKQRYKRFPRGCNSEDSNSYLYLYDAMFAYKEYELDEVFFTKEILEKNFKLYQDMFELQQWVYELTNFKNSK